MQDQMQTLEQYQSGLSDDKQRTLCETFNPFMAEVQTLKETAETVEVASVEDRENMALARATRLELKKIRVDCEKRRKELKEASLREGKAIDGMANIIKFIIVPLEERLQEQEDYAKRIEKERLERLAQERTAALTAYEIDVTHFNLAQMEQEAFDQLLETSRIGYEAKQKAEAEERARQERERLEAEKKAEEERLAREKAEVEERQRLQRERKEAEKRAEEEATERKRAEEQARKEAEAREHAEAELKARREAEERRIAEEEERKRQEQERLERERKEQERAEAAERERIRQEEEARRAAPDKVKLAQFAEVLDDLELPQMQSAKAIEALLRVKELISKAVEVLQSAAE
jgi:hypothetical protein